jgi:ATP-dependent DNA ligase
MSLPIAPPFPPMEAEAVGEIPEGFEWQYEPKWDGFRCLAFRDGARVELQSKAMQPLARYFPEVVAALAALEPRRFVLDGEIVIPVDDGLSFDDLLERIHPAESRVNRLARERPAMLIVFDLLVDETGAFIGQEPLASRRAKLEAFAKEFFPAGGSVRLSPATRNLGEARGWLRKMGGSLDGLMAKRADLPYAPGERGEAMQKIKFKRTADCVVGGFRYGQKEKRAGSLLLGLYDEEGLLHHVGFTAGIKTIERGPLTLKLERLIEPPGFTGRAPGGPSRWAQGRSTAWEPLRPELVVEVEYDHFTGGRFRHGTRLVRWRPDKAPRQCTLAQVERESASPLAILQA